MVWGPRSSKNADDGLFAGNQVQFGRKHLLVLRHPADVALSDQLVRLQTRDGFYNRFFIVGYHRVTV